MAGWRKNRKLPFPSLEREEIERLRDTLDYPPFGSPKAGTVGLDTTEAAEHLSRNPDPVGEDEEEAPDAKKTGA